MTLLDSSSRSSAYSALLATLTAQSSVALDPQEFSEAIKALEAEGLVKVVGERERRTVRKIVE